jgi:hypothetical protein
MHTEGYLWRLRHQGHDAHTQMIMGIGVIIVPHDFENAARWYCRVQGIKNV